MTEMHVKGALRMKRITATIAAFLWLIVPAAVLAHDPKLHKGKPVDGEVTSIKGDRFELKTANGTVPVTFSSKTKFEHGNATVDKTHLTTGQKVKVFGTKLPSGDLVAKEVLLGVSETTDQKKIEKGKKPATEHKH
jgi:hypothetical protein